MNLNPQFLKVALIALALTQFAACGYKPSSKYAREVVGEKISTSVVILAQDPENTVVIKDAVDSAIIKIFHASLSDRQHSQTHLSVSVSEPTYSPIQYDGDGYVVSYRANIVLLIVKESQGSTKRYSSSGTYDFSVVPNAILTDQERFDAIRFSSIKAISSFVAQISAEGSRKTKE
jgi:hypothetical protein